MSHLNMTKENVTFLRLIGKAEWSTSIYTMFQKYESTQIIFVFSKIFSIIGTSPPEDIDIHGVNTLS